jgi:Transposase DDE domain/Transposase domain (DUF772)
MNSLRHLLSQFSNILQNVLFPALTEELGGLSEAHQNFVRVIAMLELDRFVPVRSGPGRPGHNRANLLRAFVAKSVFQIPHTRALLDRLHCDVVLLRLCGWERAAKLPDETIFSRAFAEFASTELPQRVHAALIHRIYADRLVGHVIRDASAIEAREKVQPKPKTPRVRASRRKRDEPRKPEEMTRLERQCLPGTTLNQMLAELPRNCDRGCKTNSQGNQEFWIGYKLHLDIADGQVPISCVLTSASVHDSQVAIPLARMTADRVTNLYDLMDCGYDSQHIREYSQRLGHVPIIDRQKRGSEQPAPLDPAQKLRFRERTTAERVYSRLKDQFGGRFVRVRGHAKIMAHVMFGVLALTVDQLLRLLEPDRIPDPMPSS